jgi:hypothetical protein
VKKVLINNLTLLLVFLLILVGCAKPTLEPTALQDLLVIETEMLTATPETEVTATPTETMEPIPCTIAFDSDRDGNQEVYRMAPDGSDTVNLTTNSANDFDPVWSPDGKFVA